jgi:cysteine-rich repeat protein
LVSGSEECDVPGETGGYSTTIAGRQCDVDCQFGSYCGDGILQTLFDEECDDGNNNNGDFCNAECRIEPAGSGGGGSSGGGGGSSGGSNVELGETQINVIGQSVPGATVRILLDGEQVWSVTANSNGRFEFATEAEPGTVSLGFWNTDDSGVRSVTFNTTFDVTQGAITNVAGVIIPPTIVLDDPTLDPGDPITLRGQTVPDATVEIHFNDSEIVETVATNSDGEWTFTYDSSQLAPAEYTIRARTIVGGTTLNSESNFSSSLQLFLGVDGQPSTPADLNRDGFVNLTDFSILIFWWQTNGGDSDPPADINGNGNVGLEDFSILLFNWTG